MSCAEKAHDTSVSAQATPSETSEVQPPLTQGEQELIRSQIAKNWVIDIGMEGLEEMAADIVVEMNPNGTVQSARAEPATDNGHPNWKYFARSCVRAVLRSSPLRMPANRPYEQWKRMTLRFSAREMAGL